MDALFKSRTKTSAADFDFILNDGGVIINMDEWRNAIKSGQDSRIESARAFFRYDISKRYANDYDAFIPFVERMITQQ